MKRWLDGPGIAALLLCHGGAAAGTGTLEIPHRQARIEVDGRIDDWDGSSLTLHLAEPELASGLANRGTAHLSWDRDHLWLAFEVTDGEVFAPPPEVGGADLAFYDSVELYLDTRGDGGGRMGPDDFQFIITCDGRFAVLQGDSLRASVEILAVPKGERDAIGIEAAATRSADGYVVECAIPLAMVGITGASPGTNVGIDLAWNDWIEDHPPVSWPPVTVEGLARMNRGEAIGDEAQWAAIEELNRRAYRPWSLAGVRDFGYPEQWARVRFVGRPPLGEQVMDRLGPRGLLLAAALLLGAGAGGALLVLERRHRKTVGELITRLENLGAADGPPASPGEGGVTDGSDDEPATLSVDDVLSGRSGAIRVLVDGEPGAAETLAECAIVHIQERLAENISSAGIAEALHVSLRTLQRDLSEGLGCTPSQLVLALRMRKARRLLETGTRRVGEVAAAVGFANPFHFSRRFKAHYRIAPSEVARSARQERELG